MSRRLGIGVAWLALLAAMSGRPCAAAESPAALRRARYALLDYDPGLDRGRKPAAIERARQTLADLGIRVAYGPDEVRSALALAGAGVSARPVGDPALVYDAFHYLADLARLPAPLPQLFPQVVLVSGLKGAVQGSGASKRLPMVYDSGADVLFVDHSNLNQLETFGAFLHPKVNVAMILEVALEARLQRLGAAARRELGLEAILDDAEWSRLNGGRNEGRWAYTGEDLSFVGWKAAVRVTPPGMLYDAWREVETGVPADSYAGLPEPTQPWWSPRAGPAADRQNVLRCLLGKSPGFFARIGGVGAAHPDRVLEEKTRLVLYAAFVASGGTLDHGYWMKREPGNRVLEALTSAFDRDLLGQLEDRLSQNPETASIHIALR